MKKKLKANLFLDYLHQKQKKKLRQKTKSEHFLPFPKHS